MLPIALPFTRAALTVAALCLCGAPSSARLAFGQTTQPAPGQVVRTPTPQTIGHLVTVHDIVYRGRIADANTGAPLAGSTVELLATHEKATSGAEGYFSIRRTVTTR